MAFTRPQISNKGKLFDIIELTLKADKTKYWGWDGQSYKREAILLHQFYIRFTFICIFFAETPLPGCESICLSFHSPNPK